MKKMPLADCTCASNAVHPGHLPIEQQQPVGNVLLVGHLHQMESLVAVDGYVNLKSEVRAHFGEHDPCGSVVIDDEHTPPMQCRCGRAAWGRSHARLQPKAQSEVKTATRTLGAVDLELAAHQLHEVPADRQPEPGAAIATADRSVGLRERLEQALLLFGAHADPGVTHFETQSHRLSTLLHQPDSHDDLAPF